MGYLDSIENKICDAQRVWVEKQISVPVSIVVSELIADAWEDIQDGNWDQAVKFSEYAHEIASSFGCEAWFGVFLEIRQIRDLIVDSLGSVQKLGLELPVT